jgi:hypothetical protein
MEEVVFEEQNLCVSTNKLFCLVSLIIASGTTMIDGRSRRTELI